MQNRVKTLNDHIEFLQSNPGNSESVDALLEAIEESQQRERHLIARIDRLESQVRELIIRLNQLT